MRRQHILDLARGFSSDARGTIAVIFALVLVPVIGVVSLAIDYGRALKTKSLISNAADAALQGVLLNVLTMDRDEITKRVRVAMDANLPQDLKGIPFTLRISEPTRTMQLDAATVIPTAVISLIGIERMDVAVTSTVKWPEPKPVFDIGPAVAGRTAPADAARAAEQLARQLERAQTGSGAGAAGLMPLSADQVEQAKEALQSPDMQRVTADLEAQMREMRDAIARARR